MNKNQLLSRISIDPHVCFGKPCIKGHRIWVSLILDFLASGMTITEILKDYPQLATEDILACIAYGAEMSRDRFIDIPTESKRCLLDRFTAIFRSSVSREAIRRSPDKISNY